MSSERKEEVRSLRTSKIVETSARKVVPSSQVLDKFIRPEKLIADRSSSDINMGTEALDRFMLLWRGIAAFVAFPEYQSDPEKSWRLIEEELKMLEQMGVNVLNPIAQIRLGVMNVDVLMKSVPEKDRNAAMAIVSFLSRAVQITKSGVHDEKEKKYQVEHIDSMMLFKNLLDNKWRRRQEEAREEYFREFHKRIQDQYGKNDEDNTASFLSNNSSMISKYFTPL
eukprot:g4294.t1